MQFSTSFIKNVRLITVVPAVIVICYMQSCANPVPPSGGDKDTSAPVLKSIGSIIKDGQHKVTLEFDENITTKGTILYSPIAPKKTGVTENTVSVKRNVLEMTIPERTSCVYLDNWVLDLNEKNPLRGNALLFSGDSGEVHIKVKSTSSKFGVFIQKDSLQYVPQNKGNLQYHFQGLPNGIHETYVIDNDNNQHIDKNESYNVFYSVNRAKDTFFVQLYPPKKIYKAAYLLKNTNQYCIVGCALYHDWMKQSNSILMSADTLFIPSSLTAAIQEQLQLDSFISTSKKINPNTNPIYGILDTITNPTDVNVMIRIHNKQINYIYSIGANQSLEVILSEGNYDWTAWINDEQSSNLLLNIEGYDFGLSKPLDNPESFFVTQKPWIIKK
ncbi:MAG: hypothetical protein RI977_453, partial [Bacteroidota bacterium]